jgi:hypothetical protein
LAAAVVEADARVKSIKQALVTTGVAQDPAAAGPRAARVIEYHVAG